MANNRFLQSNLVTNDLATETTQKALVTLFETGTAEVSFPPNSKLNIQTDGLTDKVQCALDTADITNGPIPVSIGAAVISDVLISGVPFQTDALRVSIDENDVTGGIPVNLKNMNDAGVAIGIGIADLGTQRMAIISDQPELKSNQTQINGQPVITFSAGLQQVAVVPSGDSLPVNNWKTRGVDTSVSNGVVNSGTPRVCIASDNADISIKNGTAGNIDINLKNINGIQVQTGASNVTGLEQRVILPNNQPDLPIKNGLAGEIQVDLTEVNSSAILLGNGTSGIRISQANDQNTFSRTYLNEMLKNPVGIPPINANKNYAGAATDFEYVATADNTYITRVIVYIEDTLAFSINEYGGIGSILTNGVKFYTDNGARTFLHPDLPIKQNGDYMVLCYDVKNFSVEFSGNDAMVVRWTFAKGWPLKLDNGDSFGVQLEDDLSGLVNHYFTIQGYVE